MILSRKNTPGKSNPIEIILNPLSWYDNDISCTSCEKTDLEIPKCHINTERVCENCVIKLLLSSAQKEEIRDWPLERFKQCLANGNVYERLIVLFRFMEIKNILLKQANEAGMEDLETLCVRNLGYIDIHPLDRKVRQAALSVCLNLGKEIIPIILAEFKKSPWPYYVNMVHAAARIAPENLEVQALVKEAVTDLNPFAAARIIDLFAVHDSPLRSMIIETASSEARGVIRNFVEEIIHLPEPKESKYQIAMLNNFYGLHPLEDFVSETYNADILKKLYTNYICRFFGVEHFPMDRKFALNRLRKMFLVKMLSIIFSDKELFLKLLDMLPAGVEDVLNQIVWEGGEHDIEKLEKTFNIEIVSSTEKKHYGQTFVEKTIKDDYFFFCISGSTSYMFYDWSVPRSPHLYLPEPLRELFKSYLPFPKGYILEGVDKVEPSLLIFEDKETILNLVRVAYTFINQGSLRYGKTGKILKSSINEMARVCQVHEFYDKKHSNDHELLFMRTRLMTDALTLLNVKEKNLGDPPVFLKAMFEDFFRPVDRKTKYFLRELLFHLKGLQHLRGGYHGQNHQQNETHLRASLLQFLRTLTPFRWFSIDNSIKNMIYRSLPIEIIQKNTAYSFLYFEQAAEESRFSIYEKVEINFGIYHDTVVVPCIKAVMFIFASFGLIDIAFEPPKNPLFNHKGKWYLSIFDGLKYFRLNRLGAYVFGLTESYEAEFKEETGANVNLDENRLILSLDKEDRLKTMVLEQIAEKISDNCYKISYSSFLKDCRSKTDLKKKIQLFKKDISSELPPMWQAFFNDLTNRVHPLDKVQGMLVYKLKKDRALAELIATDEMLKKYILKAENYHIVVSEKDRSKLVKRLEEFGYFVEN